MESHKGIIPCERCENSSKLHQIKTHRMTPLLFVVEIPVCQKICGGFFSLTKCRIHVNNQNLNSFFFHVLLD